MKSKHLIVLTLLLGLSIFQSCKNDSPTFSYHTTPSITAQRFVDALNDVDADPSDPSILKKPESLQEGYIVIYDAEDCHYRAVSMDFLRNLEYWATHSSDVGTASEYRHMEFDDLLGTYESERVVFDEDLSLANGFDTYVGIQTGLSYEDEADHFDVALAAREAEDKSFYEKAASVSIAYNVKIESALQMVKLGQKVELMIGRTGELTTEDSEYVMSNLKEIAGVNSDDIMQAMTDSKKKAEVISKIAEKIGTSTQKLEDQILPELLGM